jgi:hypothetical protein
MAGVNWREAQAGAFLRLEEGFDPRMLARDALLDLVEAMVHHPSTHQGGRSWTSKRAMKAG